MEKNSIKHFRVGADGAACGSVRQARVYWEVLWNSSNSPWARWCGWPPSGCCIFSYFFIFIIIKVLLLLKGRRFAFIYLCSLTMHSLEPRNYEKREGKKSTQKFIVVANCFLIQKRYIRSCNVTRRGSRPTCNTRWHLVTSEHLTHNKVTATLQWWWPWRLWTGTKQAKMEARVAGRVVRSARDSVVSTVLANLVRYTIIYCFKTGENGGKNGTVPSTNQNAKLQTWPTQVKVAQRSQ
jgi:hypothetical protein